jgi:hypothetical protein
MTNKTTLVDALNAVQLHSGVVKLYFVSQDLDLLAQGVDPAKIKPELAHCIAMPLTGFLYSLTAIHNFLRDERMREMVQKLKEMGTVPDDIELPDADEALDIVETGAAATKKKGNGATAIAS